MEESAARSGGQGQASRLRAAGMLVVFDVAGPLAAYYALRSASFSPVSALLLAGILPALGVAATAFRHRRLDALGALVLAGIVVGTVLGAVSHDARLVLVEGSVPTAVFGAACLGSVASRRPLMFSLALEFTGPDTDQGREMSRLWHYPGFRNVFRVITAVWGAAFLVEAALRVVVVYTTSTGTALALSNVTPFVFAGVLSAWTVGYGAYRKRKGTPAPAPEAGIAPTGEDDPRYQDISET